MLLNDIKNINKDGGKCAPPFPFQNCVPISCKVMLSQAMTNLSVYSSPIFKTIFNYFILNQLILYTYIKMGLVCIIVSLRSCKLLDKLV